MRRWWARFALAAWVWILPCAACSAEQAGVPTDDAETCVKDTLRRELLPGSSVFAQQGAGTAPSGSSDVSARGPLSSGSNSQGGEFPLDVSAAWCRYHPETQKLEARGAVRMLYRGYTVTAEWASADLRVGEAVLGGGVRIFGDGQDVRAVSVRMNLKTQEWSVESAHLVLQPEAMVSPLYIEGAGLGKAGGKIEGHGLIATTCDRSVPHYRIEGRGVVIVPDRRMVIRGASLYIGRVRWFTWERLTLPLRRAEQASRSDLSPEVGQSSVEGLYLKTSYTYPVGKNAVGTARLDFMTKLGAGLGLEQAYRLAGGGGSLILYSLLNRFEGRRELTGSFRHRQRLGSVELELLSDMRRNSTRYFAGTSTTSHQFGVSWTSPRNPARVVYRVDNTGGGFGGYRRSSLEFNQSLGFGRTSARLGVNLFDTSSPSYSQRELDTSVNVTSSLKPTDLTLTYTKRQKLSGSDAPGYFASLDRLPELSLRTTGRRLGGFWSSIFPGSVNLAYGEYRELPSGVHTTRLLLDLQADERRWRLWGTEVSARFGFRQAVYGNSAAQYVVSSNVRWNSRPNSRTSFNIYHSYLNPVGYSPFRFDQPWKYNTLAMGVTHRSQSFDVSASTGVDLRGGPFRWQDMILRARYQPGRSALVLVSSAYDLNRGKWRDLLSELRLRSGSVSMDLGTRFSPMAGRFSSIKWHLIAPFAPKMRLESLGGYNGYTRQFDYHLLRITRDHHDWETSLVFVEQRGYRFEHGVRLEFRLKAFPVVDQFAVGQSGQYLDTAVGDVF